MFMQSEKLLIVYGINTKKYANYLLQLVSSKDDKENKIIGTKDGTVSATIWSNKEYEDNIHDISSEQYIVFIGDKKEFENDVENLKSKYKKYGLSCSWLGSRAFLTVERTKLLFDVDLYNQFIEMNKKNGKKLKKVQLSVFKDETPIAKIFGKDLIGEGLDSINNERFRNEIRNQQYNSLILLFYLDYLTKFLED